MAESLSINGTALSTHLYAVQATRGLVGAPSWRGGSYELPGRPGALAGAAWAGPRIVTVTGLLVGNSTSQLIPADARARYLDRIRALAALVTNGGEPFTLTRVIPRASGGDLTVTAQARYLGGLEAVEQVAAHAGRVAFDLEVLDPFWYTAATADVPVTFSVVNIDVAGDVPTHRIILDFVGTGSAQRLTNTTTGAWIQLDGGLGTVDVDVENFIATHTGTSVAGHVTSNPDRVHWFDLAPGVNALELTGVDITQVDVSYQAAYL